MEGDDFKMGILEIWGNLKIPVVFKKNSKDDVLVRIEYKHQTKFEFAILNDGRTHITGNQKFPTWDNQYRCWRTAKTKSQHTVEILLKKFGEVYYIHGYKNQVKCAPACWNAKGTDCQCSCMGANHGQGVPGGNWFVVNDTLAVQYEEREYSCRLLKKAV
jgi:hypothetical protein